jgi:hypothetical protein
MRICWKLHPPLSLHHSILYILCYQFIKSPFLSVQYRAMPVVRRFLALGGQ